jgi:thiamine-phosphate pyrophosphorylase
MALPRFYPILDTSLLRARGIDLYPCAASLHAAGVNLLQYRDKTSPDAAFLRNAETIAQAFDGSNATLILNDRIGLVLLAGWHGVHVGQGDTPVDVARVIVGDGRVIGISTHTEQQVVAADASRADYVAIGPVFSTSTKLDAEKPVGLDGVKRARALTAKPLVAIGGITRENARGVIDAGADSVAVISGLIVEGETVEKVARDFLEILR